MTEPGAAPEAANGDTRPISVAELLAKNGTIGAKPVSSRRRRLRGNSDAVTVAELTGEIPVIRDDTPPPPGIGRPAPAAEMPPATITPTAPAATESAAPKGPGAPAGEGGAPRPPAPRAERSGPIRPARPVEPTRPVQQARPVEQAKPVEPAEPERPGEPDRKARPLRPRSAARWPKSAPQTARGGDAPEPSPYPRPQRRSADDDDRPRPVRRPSRNGRPGIPEPTGSGAERMSPDPLDDYLDAEVDVTDTEVPEAELPDEDSAYVRSVLRGADEPAPVGRFGALAASLGGAAGFDAGADRDSDDSDDDADAGADALDDEFDRDFDGGFDGDDEFDADGDADDEEAEDGEARASARFRWLPAVASTTGQAVLALAFGLGVFYAFGKLWAWNSLLALVLTVLVTLGMVAAVQAVRRTVDIVSTLMAVAVGLGLTLGPLALQAR